MKRRLLITALLVAVITAPAAAQQAGPRIYLPLIFGDPSSGPPCLSALLYDGYLVGEPDEAFEIHNPAPRTIELTGWRLASGSRQVIFPAGLTLAPESSLWCSRSATAFRRSFGESAGCEYAADSDPAVPDMTGTAPQFANTGGRIELIDPTGNVTDVLVYKAGNTSGPGWRGAAVTPFRPTNSFGEAGQILYRKRDEGTAHVAPDTDARSDWAQDPDDVLNGRKARYPGWSFERFFWPSIATQTASLQVFVAPDHSFEALSDLLSRTLTNIRFEGYTFESAELAEILAERARAGVRTTLLLEGGPTGGVTDQQRWCVQQIEAAGGSVHFMRAAESGVRQRYKYQHAKFWILDETLAIIGSENPSPESFPADDKADGTIGRRGVYVATDAPVVVARLQAIMADDLDPDAHEDIWRWQATDPLLGAPPPEFVPARATGGTAYQVRAPSSFSSLSTMQFEVVQAPERALGPHDGLLGLVARAGAGDTVLIAQLDENLFWGPGDSNIDADPNPRLEAYVDAARRGAKVRVMLDAFFDNQDLDDPRSNLRTVEYLTSLATMEGLDLEARRSNPAGLGLHNKMVLAQIDGQGWIMAGSLNGSEVSTKLNREVALVVSSNEAFSYLADLFWGDWYGNPTFR